MIKPLRPVNQRDRELASDLHVSHTDISQARESWEIAQGLHDNWPLVQKIAEYRSEIQTPLVRQLNDQKYMVAALVNMLGPKARQVYDQWKESGVERVHFSWGPDARTLTGEERAEVILNFEAAPRERIENIDSHIADSKKEHRK